MEIIVQRTLASFSGAVNALRAALGETVGLGSGPGWVSIILPDGTSSADQALAQTVLGAHNQLVVLTNKATITADGVDEATLTCNDAAIGADSAIDYTVWLNTGERYDLYAEGSDTLAAGAATLTLKTNTPGSYRIEVRRQSGNFASGYVTVEAQ